MSDWCIDIIDWFDSIQINSIQLLANTPKSAKNKELWEHCISSISIYLLLPEGTIQGTTIYMIL